jgi:hypothetical protein
MDFLVVENNTIFNNKIKIIRQGHLAEKIVIIDGQPGCGKTMLSPIVASMNRIELLNYAFEIEFICRLFYLNKIDNDATISMVRMLIDHKLYQTMMGRETNFRYSDLSSVFKDSNPWKYFRRIFQDGDISIPRKIKNERPILNLNTHDLLSVGEPILSGLGDRVLLIEVVRHPLYMVKQQELNMINLFNNSRDIQIDIEHKGKQLPYYTVGWEDKFLSANSMEKAIYSIERLTQTNNEKRKIWVKNNPLSIITIPFEKFVIDPYPYLDEIEAKLGTTISNKTHKVMKKQNIPRKIISDSPALSIYKRCGWTPPSGVSEEEELEIRKNYISNRASINALEVMNKLSEEYTKEYLL